MQTIIIVAIAVVVVLVLASGYVKAPTDRAYIISGLKKEPKVLIGRAGIKIPFLERKDELILKQISIDIKTNGYVPTTDYIGVDIDAIAKVRVLTDRDIPKLINEAGYDEETANNMVKAAMRNFLNMGEGEIIEALTDSLQGNMREIIGAQPLRELCQNRKAFGDEVQDKAQKDMNALGIWIESCNIQKMEDEQDLINALGMDNMAAIQKNASIAKAEADRDVAIAQAEAEKLANDAKVAAETEIAEKQNELAIKQAELKQESDTKRAIADAAYEIQKEEQRKTIEATKVNADIAQQDRTVELRQKEAEVKEQTLNAEVKKTADAEKYRRQQEAEAELIERQKKAEAEKYEQQQKAEAVKISADAKKYEAEQEASAIRAKGEAEADAIQAKGVAEAEALEKKAEAMKKYGQAAMVEMVVKALPEMAKAVAEPLSTIDKVTIIDSGNGDGGVGSMGEYVPSVLAKTIESVKETTGVDIREIMKAETYDAKVNKNVNVTGLENAVVNAAPAKNPISGMPGVAINQKLSDVVNPVYHKSAKKTDHSAEDNPAENTNE